jgi:hypothetical protein
VLAYCVLFYQLKLYADMHGCDQPLHLNMLAWSRLKPQRVHQLPSNRCVPEGQVGSFSARTRGGVESTGSHAYPLCRAAVLLFPQRVHHPSLNAWVS